jgi:hypothetical protein
VIAQALIMVFLVQAHTARLSPGMVGLVLAAGGGGGVLGAIIASRWPPQPKKISLILIQMLIWAVAFAFLAATDRRQFLLLAVVMAVLSLTGALGNIEVGAYLIRNVDENMLARVTSILRLMNISTYAVGPVLGGVLIQWYGAQDALFALFMIMLTLAILTACSPSMWGREAFIPAILNMSNRKACGDHSVAVVPVALRSGAVADDNDPAVTALDGQHSDPDQGWEAGQCRPANSRDPSPAGGRCGPWLRGDDQAVHPADTEGQGEGPLGLGVLVA